MQNYPPKHTHTDTTGDTKRSLSSNRLSSYQWTRCEERLNVPCVKIKMRTCGCKYYECCATTKKTYSTNLSFLSGLPSGGQSSSTFYSPHHSSFQKSMQHRSPVTHHHELASTSSSWELQARKAAASSRCRAAPVLLVRTGLLSMVRRVAAASQPVFCGEALCCRDTGRK